MCIRDSPLAEARLITGDQRDPADLLIRQFENKGSHLLAEADRRIDRLRHLKHLLYGGFKMCIRDR